MITVVFYNLLRSKYNLEEMSVKPGTVHQIIDQIISIRPEIKRKDVESAVVFYKGNPVHYHSFNMKIEDSSRMIITHFVGGG